MSKRVILFITSAHIGSNPRLVKEALALAEIGYQIEIIAIQTLTFLEEFDQKILGSNPEWKFQSIKWHRLGLMKKLFYVLWHKAAKVINRTNLFAFCPDAYHPGIFALKNIKPNVKPDLIIGHNLAALPVAAYFSKKYNVPFGFDIEDAYSWENAPTKKDYDNDKFKIEARYLPMACYLTVASPLYTALYHEYHHDQLQIHTITNAFEPLAFRPILRYKDRKDLNKVSLYWFSQTIGLNRGLQDIIIALNYFDLPHFELHLRGSISDGDKEALLACAEKDWLKKEIYFHHQKAPNLLDELTAEHDIGLALEPSFSINNDYAISNKVYTYLNNHLLVIATESSGQLHIAQQTNRVLTYPAGNTDLLVQILKKTVEHKDTMFDKEKQLGQSDIGWDIEKKKFIQLIKTQLQH